MTKKIVETDNYLETKNLKIQLSGQDFLYSIINNFEYAYDLRFKAQYDKLDVDVDTSEWVKSSSEIYSKLTEFLTSSSDYNRINLIGKRGAGKTTYLTNFISTFKEDNPGIFDQLDSNQNISEIADKLSDLGNNIDIIQDKLNSLDLSPRQKFHLVNIIIQLIIPTFFYLLGRFDSQKATNTLKNEIHNQDIRIESFKDKLDSISNSLNLFKDNWRVCKHDTYLYSRPDTGSIKIVKLKEHQILNIIEINKKWIWVFYSSVQDSLAHTGWMLKKYSKPINLPKDNLSH